MCELNVPRDDLPRTEPVTDPALLLELRQEHLATVASLRLHRRDQGAVELVVRSHDVLVSFVVQGQPWLEVDAMAAPSCSSRQGNLSMSFEVIIQRSLSNGAVLLYFGSATTSF